MPATLHSKPAALRFIFITVLLDMIALGIIVPVLPRLVSGFLNGDSAKAALAIGVFGTAWALMQLIFSPLLGALSDRFGRRPVILLSNLGLGLDYIVMALAPGVGWLLVGRILSGITSSSITTANAYISDVTQPENRSRAFGMLGAAFGAGFVLGPALGGWLGQIDPRLPFWLAAGCSLLNFCYGFLVLPESLAPEKRQEKLKIKTAHPFGALTLLRSHPALLGLAGINFIGYIAHEVYPTVFVLYVMNRYGWNQAAIGTALAVVGVSAMTIQAGVVGPVVKKLGERAALMLGLGLGAIGFALFGWAGAGWLFVMAIPVNSLWGLSGPPAQTLITQLVDEKRQGELQGALGSLRSIAMLAGPGIFSGVYAAFAGAKAHMPGAPWYLACAMLLASMLLARAVMPAAKPAEAVSN